MISTADITANTLIKVSRDRGDGVTNLKLQKLLYYAQAWHLALHKKALFNDAIEAWVHGPVVPGVFRRFRDYKWSTITEPLSGGCTDFFTSHISEIFRVYGHLTATQLERLTHKEEPWLHARAGLAADKPSHAVISQESMRRYYSGKLL